MARYNKIYAGPYTEATPQVQEAILNGAYLPGTAVKLSSGNFAPPSGQTDNSKLFILQDNYLLLKGSDVAWTSGDRGIGMEMLDEQFFNVLVPTGNNLAKGAALTVNSSGKFLPPTTGGRVIAYTDEAYNNNTGSDQLVRVRAARSALVTP